MRAPWSGLAIAGVLALAACSKLSQVGQLSSGSPNAVASTVGQPFTTDSSGIHTTVRAGADVVLSGGDSYNTPDDAGVPIITWYWQQVNAGTSAVDLVKRTNAVVSFTAPQVTAPTTLTFQLTVTTATGATATTQAMVTVEPIRDADHFLTFLKTRDTVALTAVTSAVVPANAQAAYNDTLPYTITVTKLVTYTDNNAVQHTRVQAGPATSYSGSWSAALGTGGASCTDPRNPQTQIPIPKLNLDDFLYDSSGHSTGQRLSDVMQTSDVDIDPANARIPPTVVEAEIQIASGAALPGGAVAAACIPGNLTPVASATVTADALTSNSNTPQALFDTSASAHTYYATIDPNGERTTLSAWLKVNGFNPTVSGWAADAHAVYTNNYDLGFGRDMYMKFGACDSGFSVAPVSQFSAQSLSPQTAQKLAQLIGHCDIAAVVVNYASLQAAAEHLNQIAAVAMEYSASPGVGARFTKFYVFAPDQRTGQLPRITSLDLDHRGQKAVPQSCVVCHSGLPAAGGAGGGGQQYNANAPSGIPGDLQAGFLPWDLDSFWYSDTDPGFSTKSEDAAVKTQYTRANQLDQLKLLNVGAYLTTADPNRSALERELIEGWYGGAGMPGGFDGSFVPDGWNPANNGNPANSATLYKDVFERNCRMCHTMHVSAPGVNVGPKGAQGNNTPSCSQTPPAGALGIPDQYPMGCYWQFAKAANMGQVLSEGRMPFARRTMDRLWVDPAGNPNGGTVSAAGSELITQLTNLYHSEGSTDTVVPPGTPNVTIAPLQQVGGGAADVFSFVGLDVKTNGVAGDASFVTQPSWQVCVDTGAGNCANATQHVPVAGMTSVPATFQVPGLTGNFLAELDSAGAPLVTQTLSIASVPLAIAAPLPPTPPNLSRQGSFTLDASQLISGGNGPKQWWVSGLVSLMVPGTNCTAAAKCSLDTTPSIMLMETDPIAATAGYTLNASDAIGKNQSASSPVINVTSGLTANTVTGYVIENAPAPGNLVQMSGTNLDLSAGNTVGPGQTIVVQVSCDGGATWGSTCSPVSGTATVSNTNVAFTPPPGFATNPPNGSSTGLNGQTLTPLQLEYRLLLYGSGSPPPLLDQSAAGILNVQVRARVAFGPETDGTTVVATVFQRSGGYPSGGATCSSGSGCHDGTVTTRISFAGTAQSIYCELVGCPTPLTPKTDPTRKFVDGTDATNSPPPQSVVLRHPAVLDGQTHLGGQRCLGGFSGSPMTAVTPSTCDLIPILQWIEDGANDF